MAVMLSGFLLAGCSSVMGRPSGLPAPVTRSTSHETSSHSQRVVLRWQTESESNTFAYYVYRSDTTDGEFLCVNAESPVHAKGTSTVPLKYTYFDLAVDPGKTYYYKLQVRDLDGRSEWIIGAKEPVPGTAKRLTDIELDEIRTKGRAYREETR